MKSSPQSLSGQSLTSCLLKVISQADCFLQGCGEEPTSRMRPIRDSDTEHNTVQVDAALQDRRFGRRETRCLNSKVLYTMDRSSLRTISVLVVHLLIHFCGGQSQLIGSLQPIVARVGDDIMLPCHVEPVMDVAAKTLEWTRPDLNNILVHVWRSGQELVKAKHPSYTGRTSLFTDELKHGNMSLKLSGVKLSDKGTYKCFIPDLRTQSIVEVVVASDAAAPPVISFSGVDESTSEVVLQCESKGWYPQPEVLWLDGEGNVLSAGPTETVRGPDDLYTVSSRVTVDKRHGHRFTCRVQQNIINQTRETHIHVPDDFFKVQSRCSTTTVGLAVSLAVSIMLSLLLLLLLCKKKNMSKRNQMDEVESKDQNWTKQTGRSQAAASWSSSFVVIENHVCSQTKVPRGETERDGSSKPSSEPEKRAGGGFYTKKKKLKYSKILEILKYLILN
ncbi:butyrophilin subfamily 3 member A2-like [Channa argus]|uniref:butyrophilin subfamily 3 member A2-like n=1 Tax=Channa argus TaxID=215402 RepID=UPI003520E6AF